MNKIKFVLDKGKIARTDRYPVADVVYSADKAFAQHGLRRVAEGEFEAIPGHEEHYALLWKTVFELAEQDWFAPYVTSFIWQDDDTGALNTEDLLAKFKKDRFGAFAALELKEVTI